MTRKIMVGDPLGEARAMAETILEDIRKLFSSYPLVKGVFVSKVNSGRIGLLFEISDLGSSEADTIQRVIGERIAQLVVMYEPRYKILGCLVIPPQHKDRKDSEA